MSWRQIFITCFLGFLAAVPVVAGIYVLTKDEPDKGLLPSLHLERVSMITVPPPPATQEIILSGMVREAPRLELLSGTGGRVARVFAEEGQRLKKGDPVIRLDDTHLRRAYENLQAQLGFAQAQFQMAQMGTLGPSVTASSEEVPLENIQTWSDNLERRIVKHESTTLAESDSFSELETELSQLEAAIRSSVKSVQKSIDPEIPRESDALQNAKQVYTNLSEQLLALKQQMAARTLVMPQSGMLSGLQLKVNDVLSPNATVAEVVTQQRPQVAAKVPSDVMARLHVGQVVRISVPSSLNRFSAHGKVQTLQPETESQSKTGTLVIELTHGNIAGLKPGQAVEVLADVPGKGNIRIPIDAVQNRRGHAVVFIVKPSKNRHVVLERAVVTGKINKTDIEIINGLDPGEKIVLKGADLVEHGQEVVIVDTKSLEP